MSIIDTSNIVQFQRYTIAIPEDVNSNFEVLRQGYNDHDSRITTIETRLTGNFDVKSNKIINLTSGVDNGDAVNVSQLNTKANLNGDSTKNFSVATATLNNHAVTLSQLNTVSNNVTGIFPDYSNGISNANNTIYQASTSGFLYVASSLANDASAGVSVGLTTALGTTVYSHYMHWDNPNNISSIIPIKKGLYYRAYGCYAITFYPVGGNN